MTFLNFKKIVLTLIIFTSFSAHAYWDKGHSAICQLAIDNLSEESKKEVNKIIGNDKRWCVWADTIKRDRPQTRSWHYVNLPEGVSEYSHDHCPAKGCIVSALLQQIEIFKNKDASKRKRKEALKFIGHFIGDVHNPLHIGYLSDLGGNRLEVEIWNGDKTNMHRLWDGLIPNYALTKPLMFLDVEKASPIEIGMSHEERVIYWINENREILLSDAVGYVARQSFLDQAYFEKNVPIAYYRMSFAGSRLAYLIEELLGN